MFHAFFLSVEFETLLPYYLVHLNWLLHSPYRTYHSGYLLVASTFSVNLKYDGIYKTTATFND